MIYRLQLILKLITVPLIDTLHFQVKLEGDINQGVAYYKKALFYNWHYADAMYNLGVAYGEMLKFDKVSLIHYNILHLVESVMSCLILYRASSKHRPFVAYYRVI